MCAGKMVRFIKKCLRGEEGTATGTAQADAPAAAAAADTLYTVQLMTAGSSPQTSLRAPKTSSGWSERKKGRGLADLLQSQNICADNASSYSKNAYGPLLEIVPHRILQSQEDLYLDSKGTEFPLRACTPRPRHLNHSRTNLQHLPCRQVSPSSRSEVAADSRPFSQKHLHDLFPVSVRRSMDGEGVDPDRRRRGSPNRRESRPTGPPPNRTVLS